MHYVQFSCTWKKILVFHGHCLSFHITTIIQFHQMKLTNSISQNQHFSFFVFMLTFATNRHVSECLPWLSGLLQIFVEVMQIRKLLGCSPGFMLTLSCICFLTGLKSWTCVSVTYHLSNARARKISLLGLNVRSSRIHTSNIK